MQNLAACTTLYIAPTKVAGEMVFKANDDNGNCPIIYAPTINGKNTKLQNLQLVDYAPPREIIRDYAPPRGAHG